MEKKINNDINGTNVDSESQIRLFINILFRFQTHS